MSFRSIAVLTMVLALCAGARTSQGEDAPKVSTIADLVLGDYWHGTEVSKQDLEDKVVLFVMWGS